MRLLIVDDYKALADRLKTHLEGRFNVDVADTAAVGEQLAKTRQYDIILLDLGLPDGSGQEVCLHLRQAGIMIPILVLTGEDDTNSKVSLFESGADDYLTKPFELAELDARIGALLRRRQMNSPAVLMRVGDLMIDPSRRRVTRDGALIRLRRKEYEILEYLVRNLGKTVTPAMITNQVWNKADDDDEWKTTVRVHIKYLRDKIDRPFATPLIKTTHGVGYVIEDHDMVL